MDDTGPRIGAAEEAIGSVEVNRLGLALLAGLAAVVGLAPAMLILGRPQFLPILGFVAALGAFLSSKRKTVATYRPTLPEFLISGSGGIFLQAFLAVLWLLLYALLYGFIGLVVAFAGWLGLALTWDVAAIAFIATLVPAAVFVAIWGSVAYDNMFDQLYPSVPGVRSPMHGWVTYRRRVLVAATVIIVTLFAVGVWLLGGVSRRTGFPFDLLFAQVYILVSSIAPASLIPTTQRPKPSAAADVAEKLFAASGYEVRRYPQTMQTEIDPLLLNLDFVAFTQEHAFAVEVKSQGDPSQAVGWEIAASLRAAASALDRFFRTTDLTPAKVEPLLLLIGGTLSESLRQFLEEEPLRVGHIPDASVVDEILATDDSGSLRTWAHTYLGLPEVVSDPPAAGSETYASGGLA